MLASLHIRKTVFAVAVFLAACAGCKAVTRTSVPAPIRDAALAQAPGKQTTVFAGGFFWDMQSVFERVKGVVVTTAGYAGGSAATATYSQVITETTGHAESVKVACDPSKITHGRLLQIFFSVVRDPTQLNQQEPDVGTSYRTAIFYADAEQQKISLTYIAQLDAAHAIGAMCYLSAGLPRSTRRQNQRMGRKGI
jgi:peptide-methionine (S)-S-oxide reductase